MNEAILAEICKKILRNQFWAILTNQNMFSLWRLFNKMRAIEILFPQNFSSNYSDQIMAFCFHIPTRHMNEAILAEICKKILRNQFWAILMQSNRNDLRMVH
jgi:hypothetical protein